MMFFVYATERTGSTYCVDWFFHYLKTHHGYQKNLYELFNMHDNYAIDGDFRIVPTRAAVPYATPQQRRAWLRATPERVLLKHAPMYNNPLADSMLFRTRHAICLYRRDRWQQILSYGIAKATAIFNRYPDTFYEQPRGLVYDRFVFDAIIMQIRLYDERVARVTDKTEISYEDFIADPTCLLRALPIEPKVFSYHSPVARLNGDDKETSFVNLDEVRGWYEAIKAEITR
jgi:hypothetical protein